MRPINGVKGPRANNHQVRDRFPSKPKKTGGKLEFSAACVIKDAWAAVLPRIIHAIKRSLVAVTSSPRPG